MSKQSLAARPVGMIVTAGFAGLATPLSFLFQDGNLFDHLPCRKTIELALSPTGRVSASDQRAD